MITGGMPLPSKVRIQRRQIALPYLRHLSGTNWTASATAGPGVDCRLPAVALVALPPHLLFAAIGNAGRRQGGVTSAVPLLEQVLSILPQAVLIQALPHLPHASCLFRINILNRRPWTVLVTLGNDEGKKQKNALFPSRKRADWRIESDRKSVIACGLYFCAQNPILPCISRLHLL